MKILTHLRSGALRSFKAWKGVLVVWVLILFLISLLALPVKSGFKSMIGSSMVSELLTDTVNIDVITDLGTGMGVIMPVMTIGLLLVLFFGFLMNVFVTGGLFSILGSNNDSKPSSRFFAGATSNFWSFLIIILTTLAMLMVTASVIGGIPIMIVRGGDAGTAEPGVVGKTVKIVLIILALMLPLFLLVADYARAWQVVHEEKKPFKAIGFGFSRTFRTLSVSYPLMLILVAFQTGFGALAASKLLSAKPDTGKAVFMFFLASQILFIIKILLRAWRYGSVTSAMEEVSDVIEVSPDQSVRDAELLQGQV
ncbi:MAG: hypothetical protein IPN68_07325 [Bacteroidetes bacterium]|nr:hypothetical protein [Bacteroidota bacterium]